MIHHAKRKCFVTWTTFSDYSTKPKPDLFVFVMPMPGNLYLKTTLRLKAGLIRMSLFGLLLHLQLRPLGGSILFLLQENNYLNKDITPQYITTILQIQYSTKSPIRKRLRFLFRLEEIYGYNIRIVQQVKTIIILDSLS
jgi:hypothetical protein